MDATQSWTNEQFCYLTTRGRKTGNPHTIEIWFGLDGNSLYLLSGGAERSDWVRNIKKQPSVEVRIREEVVPATARIVTDTDEDTRARRLLASKYQNWRDGEQMSDWARTALPIALDL